MSAVHTYKSSRFVGCTSPISKSHFVITMDIIESPREPFCKRTLVCGNAINNRTICICEQNCNYEGSSADSRARQFALDRHPRSQRDVSIARLFLINSIATRDHGMYPGISSLFLSFSRARNVAFESDAIGLTGEEWRVTLSPFQSLFSANCKQRCASVNDRISEAAADVRQREFPVRVESLERRPYTPRVSIGFHTVRNPIANNSK